MMKRIFIFLTILSGFTACSFDESFTMDSSARLTFSTDTVRLDTVFSNVGSSTYSFWVYNFSSDGIRLQSVRLRQGNQTGFRVNVDGSYLDNSTGSIVTGLEIRKGDSIRVFVELTAPDNGQDVAQTVEDDLVFTLESGVVQNMHLRGCSWDALLLNNVVVSHDSVMMEPKKPVVIYGGIRVDSAATLTIRNTQLFFHGDAGINVYGTLKTDSVLMRGDRLDHMFAYLPYDRLSGQWMGVRFHKQSFYNELRDTEIRNAKTGVQCDTAFNIKSTEKRLLMERCIVHNSEGNGVELNYSVAELIDCQLTNALGDCIVAYGGSVFINGCTMAQFYPFSASRGAAIRFTNYKGINTYPLDTLDCRMSIVTGYDTDVLMGDTSPNDSLAAFKYYFENSLLRTPEVEDTLRFRDIKWEYVTDTIQGRKHFVLIDNKNYRYDFHLDSLSTAHGLGCYR